MKSPAIGYRPEVDGLRAIAVLAVIFFHAGYEQIAGGFLGVDIFFVISGYLITTILYNALDRGSFSILKFYERRTRRIVPALLLTIVLAFPAAYLLMLPDSLENFGQSVVATILFSNNILLFLKTDYFAPDIAFNPLMHTWSLGVEEQYYIVIPILMYFAYKAGRRRVTATGIAAITLASFLFCLWASRHAPAANFYLIFSRAWQLGAGSLVAMAEPALKRRFGAATGLNQVLALAGLAMTILPLFLLDESGAPPSLETAIPVLGVCLLLMHAGPATITGRILAWRPLVAIGLISYSAYLFHQPIFAFTRVASLEQPDRMLLTALIPVILILAYISWRFVECPFRDRRLGFRWVALSCGVTAALALAAGIAMHLTQGLYRNWPELAGGDSQFGARQNRDYNLEPFRFREAPLPAERGGRTNVLVLGNSFARDFINMGVAAGQFDRHRISYSDSDDCAPMTREARANAVHADFVVIGSGIDAPLLRCAIRRIRELRGVTAARIIVLGVKNFGWHNDGVMLLPPERRYAYRAMPVAYAREANALGRASLPPDIYVDMLGMLSDAEGRVAVFTPDRKFISQDNRHVTRAGARYVGSIIFRHPALRALHEGRTGR